MTTLQIVVEDARPVEAVCDVEFLTVKLHDGRILRAPIWWYPRLQAAGLDQRSHIELSPFGLHWLDVYEDISVASILRGEKAPGAHSPATSRK